MLSAVPATAADEDLAARQAKGKTVYMTCAACHGMDGKGLPTNPPMAPTFIGSKLATGPAEVPIAIVLKGIQKVDAKFLGMMAPLGPTLSDDQIADVLSYVRTTFNNGTAVTAAEVKEVREKYKDINAPLPRTSFEKKFEQLSAAPKEGEAPKK